MHMGFLQDLLRRALPLALLLAAALAVTSGCQERESSSRSVQGTSTPVERGTSPPTEQETSVPATPTTTPSPSPEEGGEMSVNRIVYVGTDGNVFTIAPDGSGARKITSTEVRVGSMGPILAQTSPSQVSYAWPTWSPDGTTLAVSRVVREGSQSSFSVELVNVETGHISHVYDNEPETGPIAVAAPHYMYWSPDSSRLAFIASTPSELALFTVGREAPRALNRLSGRGPIYFSWADDGSMLLLHRQEELLIAPVEGGDPATPRLLGVVGFGFRPPVISQDGGHMAYVFQDDQASELVVLDTGAGLDEPRNVQGMGTFTALLRSPASDEVAIVDTLSPSARTYGRLSLFRLEGGGARVLVEEPLLSFFWSPDGRKIAYLTPGAEGRTLILWYIDLPDGQPVKLTEFLPSTEFQTVASFFDQYAYSHSIWSPDSSQIVFTGVLGPTAFGSNGTSPETSRVYVVDVREGARPKEIAASRFAAWSWN